MPRKTDSDGLDPTPAARSTVRAKLEPGATTSTGRRSTVAKVSHTLNVALAERLEEFAFFQRVSESAVIEYSLEAFFAQSTDDLKLGDQLRRGGAGRRRKS